MTDPKTVQALVAQDELRNAAQYVFDKFSRDLEQGYRTRDKQFAVDMLGSALKRTQPAVSAPATARDNVAIAKLATEITKHLLRRWEQGDLHVGESSFEGWFARHPKATCGDKQLARDAYAAGMSDPLVTQSPDNHVRVEDAWQAIGGDPTRKPTAEELLEVLNTVRQKIDLLHQVIAAGANGGEG